jgi:hypothetical protein
MAYPISVKPITELKFAIRTAPYQPQDYLGIQLPVCWRDFSSVSGCIIGQFIITWPPSKRYVVRGSAKRVA